MANSFSLHFDVLFSHSVLNQCPVYAIFGLFVLPYGVVLFYFIPQVMSSS